uniref:TSA: Wollemia nobilis Ref_Wollemi_Transcript_5561_1240 transcribed RNA sequence n=1 Tax=Wollemia nobilis TaxID=56998 RepID=A0A0C9S9Z5_9CONI
MDSRHLGVTAKPFTWLVHMLGVAGIVLVLVWNIYFRGGLAFVSTNKAKIFNIHPVLMFIGYIFLASEAIIAYKVIPASKYVQKVVHLSLHLIALVLGIVGIYAAFKYHNESGIVNLYSWHSWLGLGTICLFAIQWLVGFFSFFYPTASDSVRAGILPWHVFFGLLIYMFAIATAELGFLEKLTFLESSGLYKYGSEAMLVNFTALVVLIFAVFVVLSAILPDESEPEGYSAIA